MIVSIILIVLIMLVLIGIFLSIMDEKRSYNNGKCINCGNKLKFFDFDSQGGRGYTCEKCGYTTWVTWGWIDNDTEDDK